MTEIVMGRVNDRWDLLLPDFREDFHRTQPGWESGRLAHMYERVHPGMRIYDVGAEHGDFTALYRQWVGVEGLDVRLDFEPRGYGSVVPVEPKPEMWPCIRATWEANEWPVPPSWFVGFASSTTSLVHTHGPEHDDVHSGDWPRCSNGPVVADPGFRHLAQETATTSQVRLEDLAETSGIVPDAVVLDVEGAEYRALDGLGELRPLVWVSVHDVGGPCEPSPDWEYDWWPGALEGWYGKTAADIEALMVGRGYHPGVELPSHGEGERFLFYEPPEA